MQELPEPEWVRIADLHTLRDYYTRIRKGMLRRYGLWTLAYLILFLVTGLLVGLSWSRALLASSVSLLCPLAGLVDWIRTTHKIETFSAEIAKTGVNLRR